MDFFAEQTFPIFGSDPMSTWQNDRVPLYYGIQYNHAGRFHFAIDHQTPQEREGAYVFITHPGHIFTYGPPPNQTRNHHFICTAGERLRRYLDSGLLELDPPEPLIPIPDPDRFLLTMQELMRMARISTPPVPRTILLYEELLLQIYEARQFQARRRLPPSRELEIAELAEKIRQNPAAQYDFEREARRRSISGAHFRRLFKEVTTLPPKQYLLKHRLSRAAEMLLTSDFNMTEIGEHCGIPNPFYFSRLFKQKYLLPPLEYRREYRGR